VSDRIAGYIETGQSKRNWTDQWGKGNDKEQVSGRLWGGGDIGREREV
jgi:hypothetical protein